MKTDVLIIVGGPGGSAMAMFLLREGIKPVILEQEAFPRFHIGEANTGESGQVLRRLGFEDEMVPSEYPDKQVAFFSQVTGAIRGSGTSGEHAKDNTLIFYAKKFHWAWFIPLDKDVVSVGMVTPRADFLEKKQTPEEFFRNELYNINPEIRRRIPEMKLVEKVHVIPNYSYQVRGFCGKGFICIGDAHRFIDPIFSFGLTVTMREGEFAAPLVRAYLEGNGRDKANPFAEHMLFCEKAIDNLEDMIDLFWEQPFAFATFAHHRYIDEITDAFAGRIYETEHQPSRAILSFRKLLKRTRDYEHEDDYSIPIGSRFHPERAALWEPNSPLGTTEEWMPRSAGMLGSIMIALSIMYDMLTAAIDVVLAF